MNSSEYSKKLRVKAVVAVYLLLRDGAQYLLALRQNTGYQDGNWNVPSGHLEDNELSLQALARETKEEIDIFISADSVELAHVLFRPQHDPTGPRIDLFFNCWQYSGQITNNEPEKCAELKWFHIDDFPENMTPHVRHAILSAEEGLMFSELDLDWHKKHGLYKL